VPTLPATQTLGENSTACCIKLIHGTAAVIKVGTAKKEQPICHGTSSVIATGTVVEEQTRHGRFDMVQHNDC
jgi:hypothetical protein